MRVPRFAVLALTGIVALVGCASPSPDGPPPGDAAPASGDGSVDLVVYVGRNEAHVRPLVERFEADTGLDVDARYGSTGALATALMQEGSSSPADVFFAQDPAYMGAVAEAGMLAELPGDVIDRVPVGLTGAADDWVGVTARRRVLAYDPARIAPSALPQQIQDLTQDQWRGRVGLAPSHSSFVSFVAALVAMRGEDETLAWLEAIAANDPQRFDGNEEQLRAIAAGDLDVGLVNHYYVHRLLAEDPQFSPRNHSFAEGDPGDVLMPTTIGVLASSNRGPNALEFVRFMLAEPAQRHFLQQVGEYPLVPGIGVPAGERQLDAGLIRGMNLPAVASNLDVATDLIARSGLI